MSFDILSPKTPVGPVTNAGGWAYTCPSDRLAEVRFFQVTSKDPSNDCYVTGLVYNSDQDDSSSGGADSEGHFAYQINIPPKSSYAPFGENPSVWLNPGDGIWLEAENDDDLDFVISVIEYGLPE